MRRITRIAACLAGLLLAGLPAAQAAAVVPAINGLAAAPAVWQPTAGRLTVTANQTAAGNWHLDLVELCSGQVVRQLDGSVTAAGPISFTIDGTVDPLIQNGVYGLRLTPSSSFGTGATVAVNITVAADQSKPAELRALCSNAARQLSSRDVVGDVSAAALQSATNPSTSTTVLLIGASKSLGVAAIAAVAGRQRDWPVLITEPTKLSAATKRELKRRAATKVVVLGSTSSVSNAVIANLKSLGYGVSRKASDDPNTLAKLIYRPKPNSTAVFSNLAGSRQSMFLAVAYANATGQILLNLNKSNPSSVKSLLAGWKLKPGIALGSSSEIPRATAAAVGATLPVAGLPLATASLALNRTIVTPTSQLQLIADKAEIRTSQLLSLQQPQLLLVANAGGISLDARQWLNSRGDLVQLLVSEAEVSDGTAATVAQLIAARGAPTALPSLAAKDLGPLTAPATFAFSGSGNGHGIGMSQWGAYQLAANGETATEILQYYYPTTTVAPVQADADIWVSVANRVSGVTVGLAGLSGSVPVMQLATTTADGTSKVLLTPDDTVTMKFVPDTNKVSFSFSGPSGLTLPDAAAVTITWSGTRFQGTLGDAAGIAKVTTSNLNGKYRFGSLRVSAAAATSRVAAGLRVVNRVRLADEYIYGIAEVSNSWPSAALEAQAIAARSYAYNDVYQADGTIAARSSTCDCNVYGDTNDQNYTGWQKISSAMGNRWKSAVDATLSDNGTAKVVMAGDKVVQTFFSAASGGWTQNIEDAWGSTPQPYFASVPDPYALQPAGAASVARWSPRIRSQAVLAAAFGLPAVATLDFSDRFVSGAMRSVTATAPDGSTATISGTAFRNAVVSDTGVKFLSTWVWRVPIQPSSESTQAASDLLADTWMGYAKAPGSSATTAVIVERAADGDLATVAVAAAYAARTNSTFLTVSGSGDAQRIRDLLVSHSIKSASLVGSVDPAVATALRSANITVAQTTGGNATAISLELAKQSSAAASSGIVIASPKSGRALPLAVSLAARTGRNLLLVDGALTADLAVWLAGANPASVVVVGSADDVPDGALGGIANASRLNTADLAVASQIAATQSTALSRAVSLADVQSDPELLLIASASGFPLLYLDPQTQSDNINWLRRQPLAAAVLDLGASSELLLQIRRA